MFCFKAHSSPIAPLLGGLTSSLLRLTLRNSPPFLLGCIGMCCRNTGSTVSAENLTGDERAHSKNTCLYGSTVCCGFWQALSRPGLEKGAADTGSKHLGCEQEGVHVNSRDDRDTAPSATHIALLQETRQFQHLENRNKNASSHHHLQQDQSSSMLRNQENIFIQATFSHFSSRVKPG